MSTILVARMLALALISCPVLEAGTSTIVSGQVYGLWSNPVLSGGLINVDRTVSAYDNRATAAWRANNEDPPDPGSLTHGSALNRGASPGFSTAVFFGNDLLSVPQDVPVPLGTLTYLNGTSGLNSLIFGATLTLAVYQDPSVDPLAAEFGIHTTSNSGTCGACDADFISFDNISLDRTMNVLEGYGATFIVSGMFVGDPQIQLTQIQLAPGQTGGFVGQGQPAAVPEPAPTFLLPAGLAALAGLGLRRRRATR